MTAQTCPICGGGAFEAFNARPGARCSTCGALERGRYQWLVYRKFVQLEPGAVVGHFAPERFFMDHFARRGDIAYRAYDIAPDRYSHDHVAVRRLDLCADLDGLDANSFDLLIHSHVLEHLPCGVEDVLRKLKGLLKPGGAMLFSAPFRGDRTQEDLDPALTPEQRRERFAQDDHMRMFGRVDFMALVERALGRDCLIRQGESFAAEELIQANIPLVTGREPNGRSVFLYVKDAGARPPA
jgi:SAM-dependent methyltransferase